MLKIYCNFPGASLGEFTVSGNQIFTSLREEKITVADGLTHDYSWHFAFGIENLEDKKITVELFVGCKDKNELPDQKALLFYGESPWDEFKRFSCESRTNLGKGYYLRFDLVPAQRIYIANYYFRTYDTLSALFDRLGALGDSAREVYGKTIEGRPLVSYKYVNRNSSVESKNKPAILISSGLHPPECDTLGSEAIMEYLTSTEGKEARALFDFHIIPILNPDGFALGYNGCNAAQINFQWIFDENDEKNCPEAFFLWKHIQNIRPVVYFDFHAYTFQLHSKYASPYIKPLIYYGGSKVRKMASLLNREIADLTAGKTKKSFGAYAPSTLASKLTKRFNTITYAKYHLHLMDGVKESKELSVNLLKITINRLKSDGFTDSANILKSPYGSVKQGHLLTSAQNLLTLWAGTIRPAFGRLKKVITP